MSSEGEEQTSNGRFHAFIKWLGTYKGLITATIVFEFVIVAFLSTMSQPVVDMLGGYILPFNLDPSHEATVARTIMLYHSLAITFLGAVVLFALDICDVRPKYENLVKWTIVPGYLMTTITGLIFAYILPGEMVTHALFIVGLTLVFFSGVLFLIGVWPTKNFPERKEEGPYIKGINLAQWNLAIAALCILISATLGASVGAYFGSGVEPFLAEELLRLEHNIFERAIIGHLHIMLALIDTALMLIVFRWTNPEQKGRWYLLGMILAIPGTIIISVGAWLVPVGYEKAHTVINVGATFALMAALILMFFGWVETSKKVLGENYDTASLGRKIIAVFKDPVRFALYFMFMWVNVVVTAPGIYLAFNLEYFRTIDFAIELTIAIGHWHVLATLTAVIALLLAFDYLNVKGVARQIIGWSLLIASIVAFFFADAYMFEQELGIPRSIASFGIDIGLILLIAGIGLFCVYMLSELIRGRYDRG
ncbi:MAG: hypothetical protein ACTSYL_07735 [Candidatus Thorarchaeota archaeon]